MSAYDPYELLETLIGRVSWPSQEEQAKAYESVKEYRSINMFGNLATQMACKHEEINRQYRGTSRCMDCGRVM